MSGAAPAKCPVAGSYRTRADVAIRSRAARTPAALEDGAVGGRRSPSQRARGPVCPCGPAARRATRCSPATARTRGRGARETQGKPAAQRLTDSTARAASRHRPGSAEARIARIRCSRCRCPRRPRPRTHGQPQGCPPRRHATMVRRTPRRTCPRRGRAEREGEVADPAPASTTRARPTGDRHRTRGPRETSQSRGRRTVSRTRIRDAAARYAPTESTWPAAATTARRGQLSLQDAGRGQHRGRAVLGPAAGPGKPGAAMRRSPGPTSLRRASTIRARVARAPRPSARAMPSRARHRYIGHREVRVADVEWRDSQQHRRADRRDWSGRAPASRKSTES